MTDDQRKMGVAQWGLEAHDRAGWRAELQRQKFMIGWNTGYAS